MSLHRDKQLKLFRKPIYWLILFAFFVSGSVSAQNSKDDVDWVKAAKAMTPKARIVNAERLLRNMQNVHKELTSKVAKADSDKDIVAKDCLSAKKTSVGALLIIAEKNMVKLRGSVSNNAAASEFYGDIAQSEGKVRDLKVEAGQCWGKKGIYTGKTNIRVSQPPNITSNDPTLPSWKEPVVYRPHSASNFF